MDQAKVEALRLALSEYKFNYDVDGRPLGPIPEKILEAAKKYYEWIKE